MKRKPLAVSFFVPLIVIACTSSALTTEPVPEWLSSMIQDFDRMGSSAPDFVARYDYRGQVVYYVAPRCCDIPSFLYDTAGTRLCSPDGGFTGSGDGKCPDFLAQKRDETILWRARRAG